MFEELIKNHYKKEAEIFGASAQSTMEDEIIRNKEIAAISHFIKAVKTNKKDLSVLDLGCGNGCTIEQIHNQFPEHTYYGLDFSEELLSIAEKRNLSKSKFMHGDARKMTFSDNFFDVIYTERCIINILDWEEQKKALHEIWRILKPNGYYLMIECFLDGLENNNKARSECGLSELQEAYHNKYFCKKKFIEAIKYQFDIVEPSIFKQEDNQFFQSNLFSSHYFISRVLHALVTQGKQVKNTEFVRFFSFLPPIGNYSPLQIYILKSKK
jgi:ubiquinone/menaquinone biosynthesis C-methylase UbiE